MVRRKRGGMMRKKEVGERKK
nr:MAG: hypothetical protein [Bacteriophage sp.]